MRNILQFVLGAALCGCSSAGESFADARQKSMSLYGEAMRQFAAKDFANAETKFAEALSIGGLNADQYDEANVRFAVCLGANGKGEEGLAKLSSIEKGSPVPDQIEAARAFIFAKLGRAAESAAAKTKARRLNPQFQGF